MRTYPYAFHVALDGNGLNGLEGRAGVCLFHYDPATGDHAYKITYFEGASGGHAPNVDPSRRVGFLGNTGQHLLLYILVTLARVNVVINSHLYADSLRISLGALLDGIYATQLSADQSLLFTANRGQNHITIYDYPALELRHRIVMPELQELDHRVGALSDPRLGFHHSCLVSPTTASAGNTAGRHQGKSSGEDTQ